MAHVNLLVKNRTIIGNKVKSIRRDNIIPAVIYGLNAEPRNLSIEKGLFRKVFKEAGKTNVIDLTLDDDKTKLACIIQDLDIHPVTGDIRHVDFLAVNLKQKVHASVPVVYIGESKAIKELGGVLNTTVSELEVHALPDEIPSEIEIDISKIENFNDIIKVQDLGINAKYEIDADPELLLVSVTAPSGEDDGKGSDDVVPAEVIAETPTPDTNNDNK